jgi:hypothetical protein
MFRLPCALFLLVLIPSLSSCTRNSGYRQSEALTVEKRESGAVLGHVEFDDQGELISTRQLNQVTEKIRSESTEPMLLLVYIHGWNHNASGKWITGNSDLVDFRETLDKLAKVTRRKTMGVFVSWRGRTYAPLPVGVDYFHRHAAARRVGGVSGTEVLYELGMTARKANRGNRVLMVGHSLGGAVLESAMAEAVAAQVATAKAKGETLKRTDFPADLAISLNSAESAMTARKLLATFKRRGIRDVEGGPVMVSLTSQRDIITSVFWPIGNFLGRYVPGFNWFNTGVAGTYRKDPDGNKLRGTQGQAHRTTVGHFKPFFSHEAQMVAREPRDLAAILKDNRQARRGDGFIVKGEKEVFLFSRPNEPYYNDTPYWVVPIPGEFINDHWDQWNGNFIGLMTALMSMAK